MSKVDELISELPNLPKEEMEKLTKAMGKEVYRRQGIPWEDKEKAAEIFSSMLTGSRFAHLLEIFIKHAPAEEKEERIRFLQEKLQKLTDEE